VVYGDFWTGTVDGETFTRDTLYRGLDGASGTTVRLFEERNFVIRLRSGPVCGSPLALAVWDGTIGDYGFNCSVSGMEKGAIAGSGSPNLKTISSESPSGSFSTVADSINRPLRS